MLRNGTCQARLQLWTQNKKTVSVHRVPHLFCCRALEVHKYVCAPDALHRRYPINTYN